MALPHRSAARPWLRLWRDLTAAPEFYRERRGQPLELALAVAEPLLSIALATTLVASIAAFLAALAPLLNLAGLVPLAVATAAMGYFYGRRLEWSGLILREWLVLLAPIVLLWRLVTLLELGATPGETLGDWVAHPLDLFDAPFLIGGGLLLLTWAQGLGYGRDLAALHPDLKPLPRPAPGSPAYWLEDERRHDLFLPPPVSLVARWLRGGLIVALLSALGAAGVRQTLTGTALLRLVSFGAPDESGVLPNVLAYMLCGLALVSLAQLSRLRANWAADAVQVMPGMARRALSGLGALVAVALAIGLLLPTRYSLGLGDLLREIVGFVAYGLMLLSSLVAGLLALVMNLIGALFGIHDKLRAPPRPQPPPPLPGAGHSASGIAGSVLFWVAALAVLGYCLYMLLRQAEGRLPALRRLRLALERLAGWGTGLLRTLLGTLRRGATGLAELARQLGADLRGRGAAARAPRLLPRPRGPREAVAYLYLSIEERARRLGLARQRGETATEYTRRLRGEIPELDPELSGLTDLFLEARYSPHPFGDERARGARALWQRVRARLRVKARDRQT